MLHGHEFGNIGVEVVVVVDVFSQYMFLAQVLIIRRLMGDWRRSYGANTVSGTPPIWPSNL